MGCLVPLNCTIAAPLTLCIWHQMENPLNKFGLLKLIILIGIPFVFRRDLSYLNTEKNDFRNPRISRGRLV